MENNSSSAPVELSDAELEPVHGGDLWSWLGRNVVDPLVGLVTPRKEKKPPAETYEGPPPQYAPGTRPPPF